MSTKRSGLGWILAIAVVAVMVGNQDSESTSGLSADGSSAGVVAESPSPDRSSTTSSPQPTSSTTEPAESSAAPSPTAAPKPAPAKPAVRTYRVNRVVDGDTIVLTNGAKVRLIGMDAPETGECGYTAARDLLASYVVGKDLTLTPGARDDKDRYGRLLRYVNVGSMDTGLKLIKVGRAIAGYDSRDGYGAHTRERAYIEADAASKNANVCTTAPKATAPAPLVGSTDPRFATCKAAKAAGYGPYYLGKDVEYHWYRDADSDGKVCE